MQGVGLFDGDILIIDRHVALSDMDVIVDCLMAYIVKSQSVIRFGFFGIAI